MDHHYFHPILVYLRQHPHVGELFTFLVAFTESLPLIGAIIPGSLTMTIVGILIGTAALPASITLLIATVAAFIGDCIGFAIGYWYNEGLRTIWPFKKHPQWLILGEKFFEKHGGKSILIGRFVGLARSTVPMIAGLLRLTWGRFVIAAILSAVLWVIAYTLPGIMLGALSREIPHAETTRFLFCGVGVIALIWLIFWLIQHFFIQLTRLINRLTDQLWAFLSRKSTASRFIRLITNQQQPSDHHQLTLLLAATLSLLLFLIFFVNVQIQGVLTHANLAIFHLLQSIRTPLWDKVFVIITIMGMPITLLLAVIVATISLCITKQWRAGAHLFIGFCITASIALITKELSHSLRPQGFNTTLYTSSFPSGHTALSFFFYGFLAFYMAQIAKRNNRWIPYTLAGTFIGLIIFSRLYLGAHWLTDILGAALLALSTVLLTIISYRRMPRKESMQLLSTSDAVLVLFFSLVIPWGITVPRNFSQNLYGVTPTWHTHLLAERAWWESSSSPLAPTYRNNRLGQPFQPFNIQWQGDLISIAKTLERHNWEIVSHQGQLKSALARFARYGAQYHIPLLPWLYRNQPPVLFMIKPIPEHKRILELRLWRSGFYFKETNQPLWIGAVDVRLSPKTLLSIHEQTKISLSMGGGVEQLMQDTQAFQHKMIAANLPETIQQKFAALNWDGKILLIRMRDTAPIIESQNRNFSVSLASNAVFTIPGC